MQNVQGDVLKDDLYSRRSKGQFCKECTKRAEDRRSNHNFHTSTSFFGKESQMMPHTDVISVRLKAAAFHSMTQSTAGHFSISYGFNTNLKDVEF